MYDILGYFYYYWSIFSTTKLVSYFKCASKYHFHSTCRCGACRSLSDAYEDDNGHDEVQELSEKFVMVLVSRNDLGDDDEYDAMLKMDGGYFPKTVFA